MINFSKYIERLPATTQLKVFGIAKIPLIFLVNPKVEVLDESQCSVKIPLNYMTRNHLKSMYFGALAIGADTVVAVLALDVVKRFKDCTVVPIFKSLKVEFLKRAEDDVVFHCLAGEQILNMIVNAKENNQRITESVEVIATVPSVSGETVAKFELELSLRVKSD